MFTIGCDPEVFVKKGESFVSAHGLIPGTKKEPFKVDKGAVQVDGMALEFNIDPASSEDEFVDNINTVLETLKSMVPDYNLEVVPTATFSKKVMQEAPEEALELGCDPDYDAYTSEANSLMDVGDVNFRTGAGHVHIGWTEGQDIEDPDHVEACQMLVRQLDYYLGLGSILFDDDDKRRTMYGKAGAYRVKPYGVEYRTLSNQWIKDEALMRWVYKAVEHAFKELADGHSMHNEMGDMARIVINRGGNKENTKNIITRHLKNKGIPLEV